jgi:hypothetical protein
MQPLVRADFDHKSELTKETLKNEEIWTNDIYVVQVLRNIPVTVWKEPNGNPLLVTEISIRRKDREAIPDWRHFQWIKNQLVGEQNEGVELYPAEDRLLDTANQYYIWVFQNSRFRFPFGHFNRMVLDGESIMGEKQRPFPKDRRPQDIEKHRNAAKELLASIKKEK